LRVTVTHNTIHDGPRAGINIGDGTWGGHHIDHNDIWNMVKETGDHGPINAWGRDRFWPISGASDAQRKQWSTLDVIAPIVIEYNRIWHNSEWAVDLDDGSSNYILRNNLFLNSGTKFREGFYRTSTNNFYVNGSAHSHVSYANNGDRVTSNIFLTDTPYQFIQADPAFSQIVYDKNVFWSNGGSVGFSPYGSSLSAWQQSKGEDSGAILADPKFTGASPWGDPAKTDWTLDSTSPALSRGFVQIPMGAFGRPGSTEAPPPLTWPNQPAVATSESWAEPWLGAQITGVYSDALASSVGLSGRNGIYLQSVPTGSAAANAGLLSGDVIRTVNGTTLTQKNSFWTSWNQIPAGASVQLGIWRNQAATTITLIRPGGVERINNTSGVGYAGSGWLWKDSASGGNGNWLSEIDASTTSGDSFTLTFHGTSLKMITETYSDETTMMVSVDNGPERSVNLTTASRVYQASVFDTGTLPVGIHTVKARSTNNGYFIVDAFDITRDSGAGPITSALPGNKCVDVNANASANGTHVQMWDCNSSAAQLWSFANGTLTHTGKCLDVNGGNTANGTVVQVWDCNGGTNQQWSPLANGSLKSVQSGRCLDDPEYNTSNGTQLVIWDCGGGANQRWALPPAS
jgi:hypothetical protein